MKESTFIFVIFVSCILISQNYVEAAVEPNALSTPTETDANIPPVPEPNAPQPKIKVESALYDFGEVGGKTVSICHFKFTNIGEDTLIISDIRSTCGCSVPSLPKKEYAPGESGSVEVRFTAPGVEGDVVKHLYIQSNDRQNPEAELIVKAKVVTRVKFEPELMKLSLKEENAGCLPIKLSSTDGVSFAVTKFEATANCLTADFDPNAKSTEIILHPKVDTAMLRKVLNGRISIALTHPECSEVSINFEAIPVYSLNPPMIMVLNARPGIAVTRDVWVLNNYKEPFDIESVTSEKGMAKLVSKEPAENGWKLIIDITPPASQSKIKIFSDTIFINIKGGEKLEINCRGFYEKNQTMAVK